MQNHPGILGGGDEGFVPGEAMLHALLKLGQGEAPGCLCGHLKPPGVDGAVFLFGENRLDCFGCAVHRAVGFGELGKEEISHASG